MPTKPISNSALRDATAHSQTVGGNKIKANKINKLWISQKNLIQILIESLYYSI